MDIKNLLQEFIEDNGSVGAAVAIIEDGKTSFYTHGKKSVNGNDLVSTDTIFEIGSITKVFTTLLLAEMESQKLDEPIEKYLPGVKIPERNGKKYAVLAYQDLSKDPWFAKLEPERLEKIKQFGMCNENEN
ncbi:MAG: serine hydrolase domain-containing protein [Wolbachia endosymbiont of Tyrophagus putrescentiae]|nr:serine hydrolase domain-containing protein [Wolbachia endosymbiont of Tyrophagus putrescentiae]